MHRHTMLRVMLTMDRSFITSTNAHACDSPVFSKICPLCTGITELQIRVKSVASKESVDEAGNLL